MRLAGSLIALAALLAGCTVGPNYAPPSLPVPPAYGEGAGFGAGIAAAEPVEWWKQFHDPELDRLVALALRGNLDLQIAATRIRSAREQERIAGAARLPTLDGRAGVNRIDFSKNAGISSIASQFSGGGQGGGATPGQGIAGPGKGITTWSIGLDASWEIDLFGGVARSVEAARARSQAAEWTARDLRVSIAAEVASDYLMLRSLQSQLAIAEAELERQRATLRLVAAQRQAGLIAELPERQQSLQLSNVAATIPQLQAQARAQIHALAVLAGEPPQAFSTELSSAAALPSAPPPVPPGLPSDLLRRRPDIRAAERNLAAATADIGVATADLYPKFNLMGMAELISTSLATLIERNSLADQRDRRADAADPRRRAAAGDSAGRARRCATRHC